MSSSTGEAEPGSAGRTWFRRRRPVRPVRVGRWRSFQLRRLGRSDGAIGLPDPGRGARTTDARSTLKALLGTNASAAWERYFVARAVRQTTLADLRAELRSARTTASAASAELAEAQAAAPTPDSVRAGPGETARARSPELLARRRGRVHDRALAGLRSRHENAIRAVERFERAIDRLEREDAEHRFGVAVAEHRLIATFMAERTVYDRALVRRHPAGPRVSAVLDRTPPSLSGWATACFEEAR